MVIYSYKENKKLKKEDFLNLGNYFLKKKDNLFLESIYNLNNGKEKNIFYVKKILEIINKKQNNKETIKIIKIIEILFKNNYKS